jgi:hypothetical protein
LRFSGWLAARMTSLLSSSSINNKSIVLSAAARNHCLLVGRGNTLDVP